MAKQMKLGILLMAVLLQFSSLSLAQQTLGGITGTVSDKSGSVLPDTTVTIVGDQTKLTRTQKTNGNGAYDFVNLPIGTYTVTVSHDGFETQKLPSILVQADRTATLNIALKIGQVGTTIEVEAAPAMNAVDTTNGYVLEQEQIQTVPLPTGSFTGLAILSPGVSAELPSGTGVNAGLGNQPIWANGQRDTSNTFLLNGVDASNLFNGKSTSSVASARIVNNTGVSGAGSTTAEEIQSTASPYLAIGQALPTPAPETVQEFRVNTSMYDAQQGGTSGAHIDLSTASGTNNIHGMLYGHRGTDALNAAPYFYKQDGNIPASQDVPELHRYTAGGTLGAPLIKDKLFAFVAFQHTHASDLEIGTSRTAVPTGLTDDRSPGALANVVLNNWGTVVNPVVAANAPGATGTLNIDPVAYALLTAKLPNGQYLFPSANANFTPTLNFPENVFLTQPAYFISDQAVADLDYQPTSKDTVSLKYYYQHDPTLAPFGYSAVEGFPQRLDAGSQVASITNTQSISPNFSVSEVFGFDREKVYSTIGQPFSPGSIGINNFGSNVFPGITIVDDLGNSSPLNTGGCLPPTYSFTCPVFNAGLTIGSTAASQGAFTGTFQNRWMPSANAIWNHGKHTVTFGGSFSYTQLNARDERPNSGMIGFVNFDNFLTGSPITYTADGFITTTFLQGDANRYYRSNESGMYLQDKFQIRPNLSFSAGLRFDYHGGLTEKNGRIFNFDPSQYNYNAATDTIVNNGFIVAGNNPDFPSKGVSDSTLTGRQWGLAPRLGFAWSPRMFSDKVVVRGGWGLYYDRGELFAYLSPGFASGVIAGGPFGVNQTPPWVNQTSCSTFGYTNCSNFEAPFGPTLGPPPSGNPADLQLPNASAISFGAPLFPFADYNRANKLPYTMNQTLDIQWQPRNDLVLEIGYVGNLGRHAVVPLPFNQAQIASPTHSLLTGSPVGEQDYTYGYSIVTAPGSFSTINLPNGQPYQETFEGGNVDLRVPYIGYSSESESYTAAGISAYHALQAHMEKRLSHGLQVGASYTYSHATDEQSAMGLFYNGNNPLNLRSGYGLSDFDRKHVLNFTYTYELPKFFSLSTVKGKIVDGWAISGLTVIQSGQPYSVVDYSGAVGSIYYGVNDGILNPVVPLTSCTPKQAITGASGAHYNGDPKTLALNPNCFGLPLLNPGDLNGAIPANDPYETNFIDHGQRNIFRQAWQRRADLSISKATQLTERFSLNYKMDIFNLTNTASFDIPIDDISQNINFQGFPYAGQAGSTTPCNQDFTALYVCPSLSGLGITNKTIGSPRQIQMSLHLIF
ncbi:MAG TPA: TonB-dependent receptor [Candidatus Binatus sp.]|nr:TonB-dependent receptor [Candidatus Binatus sp.]